MRGRRRILFLTGTRADFGKLKPLIEKTAADSRFDVHIFVTGMHMMARYGYTCDEVEKAGYKNIHKFINQNRHDTMDCILGKTVVGLSDFMKEIKPDMIVVHGDRVEALAGAIVGSLANILVAHIEGGEVSGTIDELIRHSASKLSHVHFVANEHAACRLRQLGENTDAIHVIGSPDIDLMVSDALPSPDEVRTRYDIDFDAYAILLFHPVTTELAALPEQAANLVEAVRRSGRNFVAIYPNNDHGSEVILEAYERLRGNPRVRMFPSMRFEHFLTLMKHADFIIGNSSAGIREAPFYGLPSVNVGTRQQRRATAPTIIDTDNSMAGILAGIDKTAEVTRTSQALFGNGNSATAFVDVLSGDAVWHLPTQKQFVDLETLQ